MDSADDGPVVVPIDFGTAIDLASVPVGTAGDYDNPVGAGAFAPLEAQLGLAHHRDLAKATDIYALGCLLHDLFDVDDHFMRLWNDPGFANCFAACRGQLSRYRIAHPRGGPLAEYRRVLSLTKHQVQLPAIDSDDTSVPDAAREQPGRLLLRLADVDYANREHDPNRMLRALDNAANSLQRLLVQRHRRRLRRDQRMRRERKIRNRQARLERFERAQREAKSW